MIKLKKGDIIKCIVSTELYRITTHALYTVKSCTTNHGVVIINDTGSTIEAPIHYFVMERRVPTKAQLWARERNWAKKSLKGASAVIERYKQRKDLLTPEERILLTTISYLLKTIIQVWDIRNPISKLDYLNFKKGGNCHGRKKDHTCKCSISKSKR
jgi:hypothetical protein